MKDRLLRSALAGVIASLWILAWDSLSFYLLHFTRSTWVRGLVQLAMGHPPQDTLNYLVGIVLLFIWNGFLGAVYTRLVVPERDGSYVGRAIGFGLVAWFSLLSIGTLYRIPGLNVVTWQTALSN